LTLETAIAAEPGPRRFFFAACPHRGEPSILFGPDGAAHRGKIVPVNASAFNKSRPIPIMIVIAAAKPVRREASLRGGKSCRRQQRSTRQHAMSRYLRLAPSGRAWMPMSLNQRGKS